MFQHHYETYQDVIFANLVSDHKVGWEDLVDKKLQLYLQIFNSNVELPIF